MTATFDTSFELDLEAESRRRLHRAWVMSALGHVFVLLILALRPAPERYVLPQAMTVDLVAAAPAAPKPAPKPAAKPAPAPAPRAVPAPPPPQTKILPKSAPEVTTKPVPPRPAPEPIRRRPRPKEMELGDAMAALRGELGESTPVDPVQTARAEPDVAPGAQTAAAPSSGTVEVSPELRAWIVATTRHVQKVWVNPPEFLGRGLLTELEVTLRADGTVVGDPEVRRSSGDPYADDNAVRALKKASPLPRPPTAGTQVFIFSPEASPR